MIDKSLPRYRLWLYKTDTKNYPKHELPSGYSLEFYKKGDEIHWANLELSIGQFESLEEALQAFYKSFVHGQTLIPEERIIFVKDNSGDYVATCSLWDGDFLGKRCQRLYWLAVSDKCVGKGIAKALVCCVLDLYNQLGYEDFIYLATGTWYYRAISIYKKFGFIEYDGERSLIEDMRDEDFANQNREAISFVNTKLTDYTNSRRGKFNEKEN